MQLKKIFEKLRKPYDVFFIDPGLCGTGYAFFTFLEYRKKKPPTAWGVLRARDDGGTWQDHSAALVVEVGHLLNTYRPSRVVIEFPELWASGVSMTSAMKGDLFKLTYLIGGLGQILCSPPILISPREWKGQLPKPVVLGRIRNAYPNFKKVPNHAADAIGMGLSAQGFLDTERMK
jgi:hypothetical protein